MIRSGDIGAIREGLRRGDREAVAALYDRCAPGMHRVLRGILGSASAADEALHDVFAAIAGRPAVVADAGDVDAYLARMARNRAHDHLRRSRRERSAAVASAAAPAASIGLGDDTVDAIAAALATLPLEQREVVVLKLWQDLTFAQIADVVGAGANTVASRYRYALDRLRAHLARIRHEA